MVITIMVIDKGTNEVLRMIEADNDVELVGILLAELSDEFIDYIYDEDYKGV